ncbi:MAG: hypothetical protein H7Y42_12370 [Chitinophagaceae bacterium]|nr:hypothetical protein [Chitinophagaceae bacterium]
MSPEAMDRWSDYVEDWCLFAREFLLVKLDPEQEEILRAVQFNSKVAVASGTSRGKDYVAAVCAICFLYLTPRWDEKNRMIANTKVIMTAPTDRQVGLIMSPEISRIFNNTAVRLPGYETGYDIRTGSDEWFLTGFKADDKNTEAWSGYHAANIMFIVTEASGIAQTIFDAIEGNLQGNSRLLLVFNPNVSHGYAASSFKSKTFKSFRLNSMNAPNVLSKKIIFPGQVDYVWVTDRIKAWCMPIRAEEYNVIEGDFEFEEQWYRPNDLFRAKVLGLFPKVSEGVLVPGEWIEIANKKWIEERKKADYKSQPLRLGVDVAGMGRDSSSFCYRYGNYVDRFYLIQSGGVANHMEIAGKTKSEVLSGTSKLHNKIAQAFIDTIGEGAGVYSRLIEQEVDGVHSVKASASAKDDIDNPLTDITGQHKFKNLRAYLYWAVRDWLDPKNRMGACLPEDEDLYQELTETKWRFRSDGSIELESKEDLKARIKRSPDRSDSLALTFYPESVNTFDYEELNEII